MDRAAAAGGGGASAAAKRQRRDRPLDELLTALGGMRAEQVSSTDLDQTNSLLGQLLNVQTSGGGAEAAGSGAIYEWKGYIPPQVATDGVSSKKNIARDAFNVIVLDIKRAIGRVVKEVPYAMQVTGLQAGFNASGVNTNIWLQMCVDMFTEMSIGEKLELPYSAEEVSAMRRDIRINLKNTKAFFDLAPLLAENGPNSDEMQKKLRACFKAVRGGKAGNKEKVTADRVEKVTAIFQAFHGTAADFTLYSSLCEAVGGVFGEWADKGPADRTRQAKIYREGRLHLNHTGADFTDQWFKTYYDTWERIEPTGPKRPSVEEAARREVTALVERRLQLDNVAMPGIQEPPPVALPPPPVALPPPQPLSVPLPVHISTMFVEDTSDPGKRDSSWGSFTLDEAEDTELVYKEVGADLSRFVAESPGRSMALPDGGSTPMSTGIGTPDFGSPIEGSPDDKRSVRSPQLDTSEESTEVPDPYSFYSAASLFDVNLGSLTINNLSESEQDNMEFSKENWRDQERLIFAMHWFLDEASEFLGGRGEEDDDAMEAGEVYKPLQMLMQQGHLLGEMIRVASVNERYCKMYYNKLRQRTREAGVYARLQVQGYGDGLPEAGTDDTEIEKGFLKGLTDVQCYWRSYYVRDMWRRSRVLMEYAALMLRGIYKGLGLISKVLQSARLEGQGNPARKLEVLIAPALNDLEYADHARPSETLVEAYKENVQTIYEIGQDTIEILASEALKQKWQATLKGDDSNHLLDATYMQLQQNYGGLYSVEEHGIGRTVLETVENALIEDAKQIYGSNDSTVHSKVHSNLAGAMPGKTAMAELRIQLALEAAADASSDSSSSSLDSSFGASSTGLLRPVHRATRPLQLQPLYRRFHSSLKF